jgi:hypothetical protein
MRTLSNYLKSKEVISLQKTLQKEKVRLNIPKCQDSAGLNYQLFKVISKNPQILG